MSLQATLVARGGNENSSRLVGKQRIDLLAYDRCPVCRPPELHPGIDYCHDRLAVSLFDLPVQPVEGVRDAAVELVFARLIAMLRRSIGRHLHNNQVSFRRHAVMDTARRRSTIPSSYPSRHSSMADGIARRECQSPRESLIYLVRRIFQSARIVRVAPVLATHI